MPKTVFFVLSRLEQIMEVARRNVERDGRLEPMLVIQTVQGRPLTLSLRAPD